MIGEIVEQVVESDRAKLLKRLREINPSWTAPSEDTLVGAKSLLEVNLHEADFKPITEIDNPLTTLIKKIYPPERHGALKRTFGV